MKKQILSIVLACAGAIIFVGCATPSAHNSVAVNAPSNSIIVDNRTPHTTLYVSRNGKQWMIETETDMKVQEQIAPKHVAILSDCTTNAQEKITLDFEAINQGQRGCIPFMEKIGTAHWTVNVGTNSPAQTIIVRTWNIH